MSADQIALKFNIQHPIYHHFHISLMKRRATLPDICDLDPACLVWYDRHDFKVKAEKKDC